MSTEHQKDPEAAENQFDAPANDAVDAAAADLAELEPLEPVAALEEEVGQLKDQLLRLNAEMQNVRRRAADDVSKAHKFSIEKFAAELLPVQESLEKALQDTSTDFDTLRSGVELTQKQLTSALEKSGVSSIMLTGQDAPHVFASKDLYLKLDK